VRSVDNLVNLYFTSVGRNSKLLLNVPPTREGLLHSTDVEHLAGMRAKLDEMFRNDLAAGRKLKWSATGATSATAEIDLGQTHTIGIVDLREHIERGQTIARYRVESATNDDWALISRGTTIGCKKLDRLAAPVTARRIRVVIEDAVAKPEQIELRLFARPTSLPFTALQG